MQDRKVINENREFLNETVSEDCWLSSLDSGFTERKDSRSFKISKKMFRSFLVSFLFRRRIHAWNNLVTSWKVTIDTKRTVI